MSRWSTNSFRGLVRTSSLPFFPLFLFLRFSSSAFLTCLSNSLFENQIFCVCAFFFLSFPLMNSYRLIPWAVWKKLPLLDTWKWSRCSKVDFFNKILISSARITFSLFIVTRTRCSLTPLKSCIDSQNFNLRTKGFHEKSVNLECQYFVRLFLLRPWSSKCGCYGFPSRAESFRALNWHSFGECFRCWKREGKCNIRDVERFFFLDLGESTLCVIL